MADNWKPYLCNVNGKIASIFVNLGLRRSAPIPSKPWLLWTWVYFLTPRPDGLSDSKEAPMLYKIEDALDSYVSTACKAIPCGRITTEGRREFYFYGETNDSFREAVQAALKGFDGYKCDIGDKRDPRWDQYLDVLYPSDEDIQRIANRELLDVLLERGDVLSVTREVRHWLYFRSESSRAAFRDVATSLGYRIASESTNEGESPFGIEVTRTQSIEQDSIDATVMELLHLSQRFEGEYDGWETRVIMQ